MSATGTVHELAVRGAIRGLADTVDAYRPVPTQSGKRSARCPKVSACIVANPAAPHLTSTIDSVLAQRFADLEVMIIDTKSTYAQRDDPVKTADQRVRVIQCGTTMPLSESFNLAVRHSRGEFVKLLSDDVTLHPHCLAAQARVLEHNKRVALVAARANRIDGAGEVVGRHRECARIVGVHSAPPAVKTIVRSGGNLIGPLPVAMFRRADFQRCGGFPAERTDSPELDLWTRLLWFGDCFCMPETLASVRDGSRSTTASASLLLQLAERIEFTSRLTNDPLLNVSAADRMVGHLRCIAVQLFRNVSPACRGDDVQATRDER